MTFKWCKGSVHFCAVSLDWLIRDCNTFDLFDIVCLGGSGITQDTRQLFHINPNEILTRLGNISNVMVPDCKYHIAFYIFVSQILYSDSENVKSDAPESDVDLDAGTN